MRIAIVGGGPAGLYLAILMKRIDPGHDIAIVERNAPEATFGWGVVFSEETLGALRDADYESYIEITDTFAKWDAIDIHYRDRLIRSRGHAFSAISRKALLAILQRRCRELGVELSFEDELGDLSRFEGADLIVGADGVNSTVRELLAEQLGPTLVDYDSRYVWFGTDLVFDAFTFVFKETEHGLFQAHAYPFDAETSTFIVECNTDVWERAGLATLSEQESIDFCEELFARELRGHRLLSNRSIWMTFTQITNTSWTHGNVVLLGDSAHTAHFSIGSGTKLAMEDSVALANAFIRHRAVEPALVDYELERRPVVERFQEAARESATYFENVKRYAGFDPMQFAFNLLTRSGRIGYANLTLRDPRFVRTLDSWFADVDARRNGGASRRIAPPPMFARLPVGGLELSNRVVLSPLGDEPATDGMPDERHAEALLAAAQSGPGLVLTGTVAVTPEGRITPECATIADDAHRDAWMRMVGRVHDESGARVGLQLGHAGRRGATRPRRFGADLPLARGGWPLVSASPIPYSKQAPTPKGMDADDMAAVRDAFAAAAARAAAAGFDLLELNAAHGYLLASFLSPLANRREDEYGGPLENRARFPLEVLDAVREAWPRGRPLCVRLSATDWARRGFTLPEAVAVAAQLRERGCDLVHVVAGQTVAEGQPQYRRSFLTPFSDRIRSEARVPTLVGGYITTGDEINTIVGAGRADLCLLDSSGLSGGPTIR